MTIECPLDDPELHELSDREWYEAYGLGFVGTVPPHETMRIESRWHEDAEAMRLLDAFAPNRFVVSDDARPHFDIEALLFKDKPQIVPGPAARFDQTVGHLYFSRCRFGSPIVLVVHNTSDRPQRMLASLVGATRLAPGVTWKAFWAVMNPRALALKKEIAVKEQVIAFTKVSLPYGWLGNMSPYPIRWDDKVWRTAEALFQARRLAPEDPAREEIRAQKSPMAAKMVAKRSSDRRVVVPQSEEDVRIMAEILRLKIEQHPTLRDELEATANVLLVEDCSARPRGSGLFWGAAQQSDGTWKGDNRLGKLWMELRARNREVITLLGTGGPSAPPLSRPSWRPRRRPA